MKSFRSWMTAIGIAALSHSAFAARVTFSGSLTGTDPTYNRVVSGTPPAGLSGVGTAVKYDVYAFNVTANGTYLMETTEPSEFDTFITLYRDVFNPSAAMTNAIAADDDGGPGSLSIINRSLFSGVDYFLVVSGFANSDMGSYSGRFNTVNGNGQVVLGSVQNRVPEPTTLMLVPMAVAGLALARRRRQA